jgi:hypothetical protein
MARSAKQMQESLRTAEAQNAVNARLLSAIFKQDKPAFQQALREGANPNAVGIIRTLRGGRPSKPSVNPPLISAIFVGEIDFVRALIAAGADVTLEGESGSPIFLAISMGYHDMVEAILQKDPGIIVSAGGNLVMTAILSFSPMALLKHSSLKDSDYDALRAYYLGERTTPPDTGEMLLNYAGNIDIIRVLLEYPTARPKILGETELKAGSVTPWDLVHNPRPYIEDFLDEYINTSGTLRCLTQPDDPEPGVLVFEVQFNPLGKMPTDAPWIKLRYDFGYLMREFKPFVEQLCPSDTIARQVAAIHQELKVVRREVESNHPHFEAIQSLSPMKGLHYDALNKHLFIMLQAYQMMSSGLMVRNQQTLMDNGSVIMDFVAGHVPSPFGIPFRVFALGLSIAADRTEKKRYQRIAALLPKNMHPVAQELAYRITCAIEAKLLSASKPSSLERLSAAQVEALAKRAFVVAIHTIHNLRDADIQHGNAAQKAEQLGQRVLEAVGSSAFLDELVLQYIPSAINAALIFSLENATHGQGHSHHGNAKLKGSQKPTCVLL